MYEFIENVLDFDDPVNNIVFQRVHRFGKANCADDIFIYSYIGNQEIPKLSHELQCEGSLTYAECRKVLDIFKNDKSPGNDGLTAEFIKIPAATGDFNGRLTKRVFCSRKTCKLTTCNNSFNRKGKERQKICGKLETYIATQS